MCKKVKSILVRLMVAYGCFLSSALAAGEARDLYGEGSIPHYASPEPDTEGKPPQTHRTSTPTQRRLVSASTYGSKLRPTGLAYWLELEQSNGVFTPVSTHTTFRSGNRIRLTVKPNRDGYLYIASLGSSGKPKPLYPPRDGRESGEVHAYTSYTSPNLIFQFDNRPGDEVISMVLLSEPTTPSPAPTAYKSASQSAADSLPVRTAAWSDCEGTNSRDLLTASEVAARCGESRDLITQEEIDGGYFNYAVRVPSPSFTGSQTGNITRRLTLHHE